MEYFNKILCVTLAELTDCSDGEAIIKAETLHSLVYRKRVNRVGRKGGGGHEALYDYSSLPERYRKRFVEKYGDPLIQLKEAVKTFEYIEDADAREWYSKYTYELNGITTSLSAKVLEDCVVNASVIKIIIDTLNDRAALTKALNNNRRDLWSTVTEMVEYLRDSVCHTLPKSQERLKRKVREFRRDGYGCLISNKIGNSNTQKITKDGGRFIIALKRSRTPVYSDEDIRREYNRKAGEKGWKVLRSINGLKGFLYSPAVEPLWYDAVFGEMAAFQKFGRKHKTELPARRDTLWYGDGTKLNLFYRDLDSDGKMKMMTTQVYEVVDAYSERLLGCHISDSENYRAQYLAFRMALQEAKHEPYEIVTDNQGGQRKLEAQNFFSSICQVYRPTAPYRGQSKTIENIFCRFQQQVLKRYWQFTGMNITTKVDVNHPNLEFIEANKDKLPTLAQLKEMYFKARDEWNSMPHPATGVVRIDMYNNSVNPEARGFTAYDAINVFWLQTEKKSTFTASGIEISIDGKRYTYEVYSNPGVPDHEWRRAHTGERFFVKYDPYDFRSVRLYSEDKAGNLRFERTAEPYMLIHRAIQEQTDGEAMFIRQEQEADRQDRIERQAVARVIENENGTSPEQHGLKRPALKSVKKETEIEIRRRVRLYSGQPAEYSIGRVAKVLSNVTFDQLTGTQQIPEKVMANKI